MMVLVGFEESQTVTEQMLKKGHHCFSNDTQETSGLYPKRHLQMDFFKALHYEKWDLIILHPPCTYTALCGNRYYYNSPLRQQGIDLCSRAWNESIKVCSHVALEQPKTIMQRYIGKKSQVIHPWQFGHGETKETWLWLHGLPELKPTNIVSGRENRIWKMSPSKDRAKLRSKTYYGIAQAMAEQWGRLIKIEKEYSHEYSIPKY